MQKTYDTYDHPSDQVLRFNPIPFPPQQKSDSQDAPPKS